MSALIRGLRGPWGTPIVAGLLIVVAAILSLSIGVNPFGAGHHHGIGLSLEGPTALVASDLVMIAAALVAGIPIILKAVRALMVKVIAIDLLVAIAAVGALIIGQYWEAAAVTFLFAIGHALEAGTMNRTRSALAELVAVAPDVAVVMREGEQVEISAAQVQPEETVLVKNGAKVPVDGIVIGGTGALDEASITGESIPVEKSEGEQVFAGTISRGGFLQVRATGIGADTTLARIIHRVEEAQDAKARTQSFMERFSTVVHPRHHPARSAHGARHRERRARADPAGDRLPRSDGHLHSGLDRGRHRPRCQGRHPHQGWRVPGDQREDHRRRSGQDRHSHRGHALPHRRHRPGPCPGSRRRARLGCTRRGRLRAPAGASPHRRRCGRGPAHRWSARAHRTPVPGKGIVATLEGRRVAIGNLPLLDDTRTSPRTVARPPRSTGSPHSDAPR